MSTIHKAVTMGNLPTNTTIITTNNLSASPKVLATDNLSTTPTIVIIDNPPTNHTASPTKKTKIDHIVNPTFLKMNNSHLKSVSPEIILTIMKFLPTFSDLNSLTRTNTFFNLLFKSNQYGVCEAIAKTQFSETWTDTSKLLEYQAQVGQLCKSSSDPDHNHQKCTKPPGPGILEGGKKIGISEASKIMKFSRRISQWRNLATKYIFMNHLWENTENSIPITSAPISDTCYITPAESLRLDRALIRYYLLVLACQPDWVEERKKYLLMFLEYNLFSEVIDTHEETERKRMTREEIIKRKQRHADPWVQFQGQDLRDIYVVCKATLGCWSQLPGTIEHGGDHIYERWTNIDDACVQQEAELHIKRMCMAEGMCQLELLSPDIFFEEST